MLGPSPRHCCSPAARGRPARPRTPYPRRGRLPPPRPSTPPRPEAPSPTRRRPATPATALAYEDALAPTIGQKPVPLQRAAHRGHLLRRPLRRGPARSTARGSHRSCRPSCPQRFATFAGGTLEDRRLSLLRTVWFTPTIEQAALGARWYSCVALALRDNQHLAVLAHGSPARSTRPRAAPTTACAAPPSPAPPASSSASARRPTRGRRCAPSASGRAATRASPRSGKPAQTICKDAGRAVASDPLNYRWSYAVAHARAVARPARPTASAGPRPDLRRVGANRQRFHAESAQRGSRSSRRVVRRRLGVDGSEHQKPSCGAAGGGRAASPWRS